MSKVLIIEDEKAMSDLIAIKFKVDGFEVDQAFSLGDAKQKLSGGHYDAILSDYLLPDGNSLDLFTEVQSQIANVPIILATNYVEDLSQEKAKSLGIKEVIVKYQVVPAQMVEKIKALVSQGAGSSGQGAVSPTVVPVQQPVTPPAQPAPTAQSQPAAQPTFISSQPSASNNNPAPVTPPTSIPVAPEAPATPPQPVSPSVPPVTPTPVPPPITNIDPNKPQ